MKIKDFFQSMLMSFFIITTLVNVATFVIGSIYEPDARFGYDAFLVPLIYGAGSLIPCVVMYSRKELTVKALLFRKLLQLVAIEGIMYLLAFGIGDRQRGGLALKVSFCVSVLIVYVLVHVIEWLINWQSAKQMTDDLRRYQEAVKE